MEKYGSFKNLAGDKKGMSAEEAYIMLKNLGLLGQEFVPGATSIRKLMEGDIKGAGSELNDWIPGGKAVENLAEGKDQDWAKNALDLAIVGKPLVKGAKKVATAIENLPKGGKEGYIRMSNRHADQFYKNRDARHFYLKKLQEKDPSISDATIKELDNIGWGGFNDYESLSPQAKEVLDGIAGVNISGYKRPVNWDKMSPEEQLRTFLASTPPDFDVRYALDVSNAHRKANYKKPNSGPIYDEVLTLNDLSRLVEEHPELLDKIPGKNKAKISDLKNDLSKQTNSNVDTDLINSNKEREDLYKAQREREAQEEQRKALLKAEQEKRLAEKAERKAAEQAAKEAKWKAEREAAAKAAEEKRLAKEAEEKRLAEEAEKQRLAEEAEAKRIADEEARKRAEEEEFERQFREEEGAERNRYADSLASVASREAVDNDINEWLYNKMAEEEKVNPVASMDEFTGESFGGTPTVSNPTAPATGKVRPSYDHSREFNGGTFQLLDPIDRGTLKGNGDLGERIFDAQSRFYTPYSEPGEYIRSMSNGRGFRELQNKTTARDPYNEAGVINDMNIKLNRLIDRERKLGFTDEEIYRKFKPEFDEYQGKIERYKTRLNSPQSMFDYDGAITTNIPASPSEEINVLRSLGLNNDVDPRMGEIMDDTRDHYKNLMKRIYQYESRFPQTPKLTNDQFKRLKDMGIRPEDIDMYLAEHPEFR
jgi:hypothetical protein